MEGEMGGSAYHRLVIFPLVHLVTLVTASGLTNFGCCCSKEENIGDSEFSPSSWSLLRYLDDVGPLRVKAVPYMRNH